MQGGYRRDRDRDDRGGNTQKGTKIYVSNLSVAITEDDLRKHFGEYGNIADISLKRKESITFAFIEYQSVKQAQAAVQQMNRKEIDGRQLKVQFARGGGNRSSFGGRGGRDDRGGRGGYRDRDDRGPRRDYGDRPQRRQFGGDRPRGCFNCGKEGHMIRDCPQPKKPREFNNNRQERGGYRGGRDQRRKSRSRSGDRHKKSRKRSSSGSSR